jgi:TPR repeat protein
MGIAYATGRGAPKDDQQASEWFEKASAQGHKGAELQLQNLRPTNAPNTFSYDAEQPVRSKSPDQQAAENGDIDAQFRLGIAYATGRGVPQNDQQAAVWFEKASAQGHKGAELQLQNIRAGK